MITLVAPNDQAFEVELLDDAPPGWPGVKVMTSSASLNLPLGCQVQLQVEDPGLAGSYSVAQILTPAAPRGWRIFLERQAEKPATAAASKSATDQPNLDKLFTIRVSGLLNNSIRGGNIRRSLAEYKVPFSRLSQEVRRLTKMGSKIVSITEATSLDSIIGE